MNEIWKPIPGYEGYYEASNMGRIRSLDRYTRNRWGSKTFHKSQFMKCRVVTNGYTHVKLTKKGKKCEPLVHRIIASLFVPNIDNLAYVKSRIGENRFGGESVTYMGVGSTKKWERLESYGPKFVENIVQATVHQGKCDASARFRFL